jgi:hypothetical protein
VVLKNYNKVKEPLPGLSFFIRSFVKNPLVLEGGLKADRQGGGSLVLLGYSKRWIRRFYDPGAFDEKEPTVL